MAKCTASQGIPACHLLWMAIFVSVAAGCGLFVTAAQAVDSTELRHIFPDPPRQYSSGPLWVWNDRLTDKQIVETLHDLAGQRVKQVFVHPRPGLMTPYLSDDWLRLWDVALREAEKLDMNVWIYDENSYPSGFAGGLVPEAMPESRGKGLALREVTALPEADDRMLAAYRLTQDGHENITAKVRAGETFGQGRYLVASVQLAPEGGWFGGKWYVDLLKPGVTEKFIEITMERYRRAIGDQFGKRVPGWFTDEPHLAPAGGLHWSDGLPDLFRERWGYDLIDHLPSLARPAGDWKRVRHNYYNLLLEQFIERWAKPCYEYCRNHGLEFTGHYWEHGWPNAGHGGDNMAMYAWHQRPAIDTLMNRYSEDVHAQFGNARAVKELSSVANQLGRQRTLCEAFGAGGWDLRFEDMKRIADWLYVLGVNTLDEHLSYITIRGARKRDHPQSFSYHEPWWQAYHVMASYFTRLSLIMSQGQQINRVLVIEPTTTTWMYQGRTAPPGRLNEIGNRFQSMIMSLERAQVEYDIGCEDIIARQGSTDGARLIIGQRTYDTVVLPPLTENLNAGTIALLDRYLHAGGAVLCCGETPIRVDGRLSDRVATAATREGWRRIEAADVPAMLSVRGGGEFALVRDPHDKGILFHHRRVVDDGQFLLLVNTSLDSPSQGTIESNLKGVETWDLFAGTVGDYPFQGTARGVETTFTLPPSGSLLLFLSRQPRRPVTAPTRTTRPIASQGPAEITRLQPNVLTLDYVDVTAAGETRKNIYFYQANQFLWRKHGMKRNPWDSAVQFRDTLITKRFPAESGFAASYRFTVRESVPPNLAIVIERADLYTVTCNGKAVSAETDSWWLDKSFGRIDIAEATSVGENVVTIRARPFTIYHELEPAYVLGDFTLERTDMGFAITPDRPLEILDAQGPLAHDVNPDGTMWLSAGIAYEGRTEDRAPFVVFDLGAPTNLRAIRIWNYNEGHVRDLRDRGVKKLRILSSTPTGDNVATKDLGVFQLARAQESGSSQRLEVRADAARFVRFEILSNHHDVTYPADGHPADNGFVGLAEVRFLGEANRPCEEVTVRQTSSELLSLGRTGGHLVDGSGLVGAKQGWRRQGHPFYSAAVEYRRLFNIAERRGRYVVSLPNWYGSVAKVKVNGELAGHVVSPPWECDVTKHVDDGANEIGVVVVGTLKNTLGPHHGNPGLGSAWPSMFHQAPEAGPPPGREYHTLDYGLFESFVLKQVIEN